MESSAAQPWRAKTSLVASPAGVSRRAATELVPELDEHLAALSVLLHQYSKHLWLARGLGPTALDPVMRAGCGGVRLSMDDLAARTLALDGVFLGDPLEQLNVSYLEHEGDGVYRPHEMVCGDLAHEATVAGRLRHSIEAARSLGDSGTAAVLGRVLGASRARAVRLERLLGRLGGSAGPARSR